MSELEDAAQTTLNIPQLIVLIVLGFLAIRWFLSPRSTTEAAGSSAARTNAAAAARTTARHVETVIQMFPQLDRRTVMWDLQRNGNNVQMTTERVLMGRAFETPPQSFQPVILQTNADATTTAPTLPTKSTQPDLIQRYNLNEKLSVEQKIQEEAAAAAKPKRPVWTTSKSERQLSLQQRREEMILAARRKMQSKEDTSS